MIVEHQDVVAGPFGVRSDDVSGALRCVAALDAPDGVFRDFPDARTENQVCVFVAQALALAVPLAENEHSGRDVHAWVQHP
jgi:hypothetical protein